ncbi:MAG: hypothetical protein ACTSQ8_21870 [Candidatus Helarchaeota archaeon]
MIIGGTPIPKRELIRIVLKIFREDQIREYYNIQSETVLADRLNSFKKADLLDLIEKSIEGKVELERVKSSYPLTNNPTLYLVHVSRWPDNKILKTKADVLSINQKSGGLLFGEEKTIQSVYMISSLSRFSVKDKIYSELPLVYEKVIEYRIADQESEDYGEVSEVISLEYAFAWYSIDFDHAILVCGDYFAVKPLLSFCRHKFNIEWYLPNLSEEMLLRLAQNADPRTAAFANVEDDPNDLFDVSSITVSDVLLGEKRSYTNLRKNVAREQTYGFYVNHPGVSLGGVGITRRYGRIWTPAKLNKDQIIAFTTTVIESTEEELAIESSRNISSYLNYYQNYPIYINNKKIDKKCRSIFNEIINSILQAQNRITHEAKLNISVLSKIVPESNYLDLIPVLTISCPNCGEYILRCSKCSLPFVPKMTDKGLRFSCPICDSIIIEDNELYKCECGEEIDITFSTDIKILPGSGFLRAVNNFINDILKSHQFNNSFVVIGQTLRLIRFRNKKPSKLEYSLHDFSKWNKRARIQFQKPSEYNLKNFYTILGRIKEKCKEKNYHPSSLDCQNCKMSNINNERIEKGEYMCLSRLFGFAIDEFFDGIHHGNEGADIQYEDFDHDSRKRKIGIHLKSRNIHKPNGIGRGKYRIKGLYAQYCYSIYQINENILDEDIMGISIPNKINSDVLESFRYISKMFNIPIIILQDEDWMKILNRAFELINLETKEIL